jgi:hypothetical protein
LERLLDEESAVAGLGAAGDLPQDLPPVMASDRSATAPAGCAAPGWQAGRKAVEGLDGLAGRAALVSGWLECQAGAARLVMHHEFLSSWLLRGSLGVLALVVVAHHRGRFVLCSLASPPFVVVTAR